MKHSIVIRTDASLAIGGGHVMRCLALAEELRRKGSAIYFVCRNLRGNLTQQIEQAGFPVLTLSAPKSSFASGNEHENWLEAPWKIDAQETSQAIQSTVGKTDWLIVDHYALDERWEKAVRSVAKNLLVIDDLADRRHDCDILLDQTFTPNPAERYKSLVTPDAKLLLGPKLALLRREFSERRKTLSPKNGNLNRLLIFFGAVDKSNQTAKALDALRLLNLPNLQIDVVVGLTNSHRETIQAKCAVSSNIHFHCPAKNMIELMACADLAIGAAGTTSWERCCLGLPAVVIQLAENQKLICGELHRVGAILCLGKKEIVSAEALADAVRDSINHSEKLRAMSEQAWNITDGLGAQRTSQWLGPLLLRRASIDDAKLLWEWANEPIVRKNAFHTEPIPWATHMEWLTKKLQSPDCLIWVAHAGEIPVGQIRFDMSGPEATVDISIDARQRGHGFGLELLVKGLAKIFAAKSTNKIVALVKHGNPASQAIFVATGFRSVPSSRPDALQFELSQNDFP